MIPHLIIDIRDRSIFSLLMDEQGNIRPCTHNVSENSLRYFYGEILLDLNQYEEQKSKQMPDLSEEVENGEYDIIRIGKKLGWMRPYEATESDIAVKHPLKVLSSVLPMESKDTIKNIIATCRALLEFILEPVFHYVRTTDFQFSDLNTIIIIPGYFNRRAQLLLHKILRKKKFRDTLIITREMAAMMASLENSWLERATLLDIEDEDTQLYQVRVKKSHNEVCLECTCASTLVNFGWQSLLNRFIHLLNKEKLTAALSAKDRFYIDNTLLCLIFGIQPSRFPLPSSLKITHTLFDELFAGEGKESSTKKYFSILSNWIAKNGNRGEPVIPLGLSPMIGHFENLLLSMLDLEQHSPFLQDRPLERPAYGVAAGINWLNRDSHRTIKMIHKASFRIAIRPGESILLTPHTSIPTNPGEHRIVKQVLGISLEEGVSEDILTFQLLWGMNPLPQYNVNVCLFQLNITQEDTQKKRKVWVTLDLKRAGTGNSLKGIVTVQLGEQMKKANFTIEHAIREVRSHDIN